MKPIEVVLLLVVLIALAAATGYYWGFGSGIMEGYKKACNGYTKQEWRALHGH